MKSVFLHRDFGPFSECITASWSQFRYRKHDCWELGTLVDVLIPTKKSIPFANKHQAVFDRGLIQFHKIRPPFACMQQLFLPLFRVGKLDECRQILGAPVVGPDRLKIDQQARAVGGVIPARAIWTIKRSSKRQITRAEQRLEDQRAVWARHRIDSASTKARMRAGIDERANRLRSNGHARHIYSAIDQALADQAFPITLVEANPLRHLPVHCMVGH